MEYELHDDITSDEINYVENKLIEFANRHTLPRNRQEFGVAVRDSDGTLVGGIACKTLTEPRFLANSGGLFDHQK